MIRRTLLLVVAAIMNYRIIDAANCQLPTANPAWKLKPDSTLLLWWGKVSTQVQVREVGMYLKAKPSMPSCDVDMDVDVLTFPFSHT